MNPADYKDMCVCSTAYCNEPLINNTLSVNNPLTTPPVNSTAKTGIQCYGNTAAGDPVPIEQVNKNSQFCVVAALRCGGITVGKPSACTAAKATEDTIYLLYTHMDRRSLNLLTTAVEKKPKDYLSVTSCSTNHCNAP